MNVRAITRELTDLKEEMEEAAQKKASLSGKKESIEDSMKDKFGISDVEEAKDLRTKMDKELQELEDQIEDGMKEIHKMREG